MQHFRCKASHSVTVVESYTTQENGNRQSSLLLLSSIPYNLTAAETTRLPSLAYPTPTSPHPSQSPSPQQPKTSYIRYLLRIKLPLEILIRSFVLRLGTDLSYRCINTCIHACGGYELIDLLNFSQLE